MLLASTYETTRHHEGVLMPNHPHSIVHLAKMQDFQGEGNGRLDSFFIHMEELVDFTVRMSERHAFTWVVPSWIMLRVPFHPSSYGSTVLRAVHE